MLNDVLFDLIRKAAPHGGTTLSASGETVHAHGKWSDWQCRQLVNKITKATTLVGVNEIAAMLGVSKQRIPQLRLTASVGFPEPCTTLKCGPIWHKADIERWLEGWERKPGKPKRVVNVVV